MKWYYYLGIAAVIFTIGAGVGHKTTDLSWQHKWDQHVAADKKAIADAVAKARAEERKVADLGQKSGEAQVRIQTKIVDHTITVLKEVPRYVTIEQDARSCVSYGLVRLLNAAVTGADPASYQLPPGVSDDACTGIKASELAASIAENYGTARSNAAQLDGLIADVTQRIDIANGEHP